MRQRQPNVRAQEERLDTIRRELIGRIRPVCKDMPEELFLDLIETMAAVKLKYELREPSIAS